MIGVYFSYIIHSLEMIACYDNNAMYLQRMHAIVDTQNPKSVEMDAREKSTGNPGTDSTGRAKKVVGIHSTSTTHQKIESSHSNTTSMT